MDIYYLSSLSGLTGRSDNYYAMILYYALCTVASWFFIHLIQGGSINPYLFIYKPYNLLNYSRIFFNLFKYTFLYHILHDYFYSDQGFHSNCWADTTTFFSTIGYEFAQYVVNVTVSSAPLTVYSFRTTNGINWLLVGT